MIKIIKNNFRRFLIFGIIFLLMAGWIFSGFPQVLKKPPFPPEIQKAQAAFSSPTARGSTSTNISFTDLSVTPTANLTVGKIVFFSCVSDNSATANGTSNTHVSVTDTDGHTWSKVFEETDSDGSAADGSTTSLWWTKVVTQIDTTDSVTLAINFSSSDGACALTEVTVGAGNTVAVSTDTPTHADSGTSLSEVRSGLTNREYLFFGLFGAEGEDTSKTAITNYIEQHDLVSTTSGVAAANVQMHVGTRILTGTGDTWTSSTVTFTNGIQSLTAFYEVAVVVPTVTTQAAESVEATTATGKGTITAINGEDSTKKGICWNTTGGPTVADNKVEETGIFGISAITESLTGLPTGATIYSRAYAYNSAGYGYGADASFLTKPAAPTGVAATDGTYTDKVTITWTKSTGATDYHVWRDSTDLGSAGDVATFDDTGADAPTITAGSAVASDGTNVNYVELSLSGTSANNGTSHTYKVVASNATGNSADSSTDAGYRGVGSLTYQWQRSAADSDADYSNIDGATASTYNDAGAPADGSGRYYKCVLNATGATQQISSADRGYRQAVVYSVSVDPVSVNYGGMTMNTTKASTIITATVGNADTKLNIVGTDATYTSYTWTLSAALGEDQYVHAFTKNTGLSSGGTLGSDADSEWVALDKTGNQVLAATVLANGSQDFKLDMRTPSTAGTETNLGSQYSTDVTIVASAVEAGDTVTATVTPGNYSVSVDPATADYGSMTLSATETSAQIAATNAGSLTEKINILGSDATYTSYTWTLSTSAPGADTIVHAFTTKATPPATGATLGTDPLVEWVPLDKGANYTIASASVEPTDIMNFYLDMRTPTSAGVETSYGNQYSSTVTLQAVAP